MEFTFALALAEKGMKVKRQEWDESVYLIVDDLGFVRCSRGAELIYEDMMACDWEMIE